MTTENGSVSTRPSNSADDDDRPLSTWVGLMQCQPGVGETSKLLLQVNHWVLVFLLVLVMVSYLSSFGGLYLFPL